MALVEFRYGLICLFRMLISAADWLGAPVRGIALLPGAALGRDDKVMRSVGRLVMTRS